MEYRWESHRVEMTQGDSQAADICDLWVTPEARNTGVASRLVQAAADQAIKAGRTKLYYWVSTENGRAIGFASNAGFRVTSQRRTTQVENKEFGNQEVAFVLSLVERPPCRGHLDTLSPNLQARATLM